MTSNWSAGNDRRVHHEVREVFEQACLLLAPHLSGNKGGYSVSKYAMARILSDHFPDFSSSQINIAVSAIERMHHEGKLQALVEKHASLGSDKPGS